MLSFILSIGMLFQMSISRSFIVTSKKVDKSLQLQVTSF